MTGADLDYYRARRDAEEFAARRATHPEAVRTHRRLAAEYASLVAEAEAAPAH